MSTRWRSAAGNGTENESSNVEYVTARVRARGAALFSEEEYRNLLRMGPSEIARFMEESTYEREINELGTRHGGVDLIEYALNANLARDFESLLRWAEGPLYGRIARYLRKFDAWNIKTILRGLYSETERANVEDDLIRAGELDDELIEELLNAGSIEEVVERLEPTIFGPPLAAAYGDYEATELLVPLENAVDRAYYENLLRETRGEDEATQLYVAFLRAEIDFRNVRNALRIARSGADIDVGEYYIEGGRLFDAAQLQRLAENPDELIAHLRESTYAEELDEALDELEAEDSVIGFERALDVALLSYADHLSHVYPLSICPVLAFVLHKEREVDNIRAIARGREAGLSPEEIEEEVVVL